ncbi:hypothetical protein VTO73DRAFT_1902 [Trametes versicolor]
MPLPEVQEPQEHQSHAVRSPVLCYANEDIHTYTLHPENVFGGSFDISLAATYIAGSIPTEFVNRMYGDSIVSGACIPGDTQTTTTPTTALNTQRPHHDASTPASSTNQHPSRLEQRFTSSGILITILPQEQHQTRLLSVTLFSPIEFHGCSLLRALLGETNDVVDRDAAAFRAGVCLPQKMSIILMFPGHARYSHQVNILRARQTAPTRAQLAVIIAREVLRFLTTAREGGAPLQFGGSAVELQDLVLMEVHHVSKSSLQPVIGTIHH